MASPRLAPQAIPQIKISIHHKKPAVSAHMRLKQEIKSLWHERKVNRYQLGRKLVELQGLLAHGKFLPCVQKELHIPVHTAYRAIKFYQRVKVQILQFAKFRKKFPFENENDFERAMESRNADEHLKAIAMMAQAAQENVKRLASQRPNHQKPSVRIGIMLLSKEATKRFKTAWESLDERTRATVVYKAVINASRHS
ncbi:MAG: hypothetical protein WCD47_09215 [Candidatus Sulfotelmatobacter sp.]|jgi:hypothetical protein